MKKIILLFVFSFTFNYQLLAHQWEMGLKVIDGTGQAISTDVFLYKAVNKYPYELYRDGRTTVL